MKAPFGPIHWCHPDALGGIGENADGVVVLAGFIGHHAQMKLRFCGVIRVFRSRMKNRWASLGAACPHANRCPCPARFGGADQERDPAVWHAPSGTKFNQSRLWPGINKANKSPPQQQMGFHDSEAIRHADSNRTVGAQIVPQPFQATDGQAQNRVDLRLHRPGSGIFLPRPRSMPTKAAPATTSAR